MIGTFVFATFVAFLTTFNLGLWSVNQNNNNYRPVYCDIKWRVYKTCTQRTDFTRHCVEDGLQMFNSRFYNKSIQELIIFSLPFYNNFESPAVMHMLKALTYRCDFNLIALDNALHTNVGWLDYYSTMIQVYRDSLRYAAILNRAIEMGLFSTQYMTALGYSMGAQISGHVCRNLRGRCGNILAIDPAGPLYSPQKMSEIRNSPQFQLVSRADACQVVFVQCNKWMLGSGYEAAHINVVVNNGQTQPSCAFGDIFCSHNFCNILMINSIYNPGQCVATSAYDRRYFYVMEIPLHNRNGRCFGNMKQVYFLKTTDRNIQCLGRRPRVSVNSYQHTLNDTEEC